MLGGWLIQHLSWRWIFFINLPLAVIVLAISIWRVPESRSPGASGRLDWAGVALTTAGLGALVFGLIESVPLAAVAGIVLLLAFLFVESRSTAPMLPLALFRSRTFAGANLLTFLLYAALAGFMFFLPLNLVQVQGYSATEAGAALLPFIVLMFVMSRWSGGLIDRYGARGPLDRRPVDRRARFRIVCEAGIGGSYLGTVLPAVLVLGLGMAISVAPLTTTVMNSVPQEHSGVASGINNAVSRVAAVLAIAVLGAVLYAAFNQALDRRLQALDLPTEARAAIDTQRRSLAAIRTTDRGARDAIEQSFLTGYRVVLWIAVALAISSSVSAGVLIESRPKKAPLAAASIVRLAQLHPPSAPAALPVANEPPADAEPVRRRSSRGRSRRLPSSWRRRTPRPSANAVVPGMPAPPESVDDTRRNEQGDQQHQAAAGREVQRL